MHNEGACARGACGFTEAEKQQRARRPVPDAR